MSRREGNAKGRSVTLHMVSSLDGFIAKKDNSVSWLDSSGSVYEAGVSISEEEAAAFVKTIDCYVLGSRTYEHALELGWPYGDTQAVVVTGREWPSARKSVEFYSGDLKTLVDVKLAPRFRNIWLVGGAMLCQRFLELGLVDEIKLTLALAPSVEVPPPCSRGVRGPLQPNHCHPRRPSRSLAASALSSHFWVVVVTHQ